MRTRQESGWTAERHDELWRVTDVCADPAEILALSIIRFVAAGYSTGDVGCWDAAYTGAEQVLAAEPGSRLVAALTLLIRAIRTERIGGWMFMPATCCRVTSDEMAILRLIAAARDGDPRSIGDAAAQIANRGTASLTEAAAHVVGAVVDDIAAALPAQASARRAPRTHLH